MEDIARHLTNLAGAHFGYTNDLREAGYMDTDGRLLDLSGRHEDRPAPGARDYHKAKRLIDHRDLSADISEILLKSSPGFDSNSSTGFMMEFMRLGRMVRLQPDVGFQVNFIPDESQLLALARAFAYADRPTAIDFADAAGESLYSCELLQASPVQIMKALRTGASFVAQAAEQGDQFSMR